MRRLISFTVWTALLATANAASAQSVGQVLRVTGANTYGYGPLDLGNSSAITSDLPYANLTQGSALSVLGVTGNAGADVASIAAGSDHQVLRRSGTAVAFGQLNLASSNAVTGLLPVANGGTGASTAATARTNLGLAIGSNVQAYDSELGALSLATAAADKVPYFTGSSSASTFTMTSFARTLADDADAAMARSTLGISAASDTAAGLVELATTAETTTGTANNLAVTPAGVAAAVNARLGAPITPTPTSDGWSEDTSGGPETPTEIDDRTAALQASIDAAYARGDSVWTPPVPAGSVLQISAPLVLPTSQYNPNDLAVEADNGSGTHRFRAMTFDFSDVCITRADNFEAPSGTHPALIISAGFDHFIDNFPEAQWLQDSLPNNVRITNLRLNGRGNINDNPWDWNYSLADGSDQNGTTMPYTCDGVAWFGVLRLDGLDANDVPGVVLRLQRGWNSHAGQYDEGDFEVSAIGNIRWQKALGGLWVIAGADGETFGVIEGRITRDVGILMNSASWTIPQAHVYGCQSNEPPVTTVIDTGAGFTLPNRFVGNAMVNAGNGFNFWGGIYPESSRICFNVDGDGENDGTPDGGAAGTTIERIQMRLLNPKQDTGIRIDSRTIIGHVSGDFVRGVAIDMTPWSLGSCIEHAGLAISGAATGIIVRGQHNKIGHTVIGGDSTGYAVEFGDATAPDASSPNNCELDINWGGVAGGMILRGVGANNRVRVYRYSGSNPSINENGFMGTSTQFTEIP